MAQTITGLSPREAEFLTRLAAEDRSIFRYADVADRWPDPAAAQRALSRLQRGGWLKRIERGLCPPGPTHAVGAHRPASAGPGVLNDLQAAFGNARRPGGAGAEVTGFEAQRFGRAGRVEPGQRQMCGVGQVSRPHVVPLLPGLEGPAGDRLAAVVGGVADLVDAVQSRIMMRMSKDGLVSPVFGKISERFRTPVWSIMIWGLIVALSAGLVPIGELADASAR